MSKLFIIDGSNLIHRAHYAMKDMSSNGGFPTGAINGFLMMLMNLNKFHGMRECIVCYDVAGASSYRRGLYPEYKGNRSKEGVDLIGPQTKIIQAIVENLGIVSYGIPGFEADDIIATLVSFYTQVNSYDQLVVVSSDKDLMALVSDDSPTVTLLDTMKRKEYDTASVIDKWGVPPKQISDYLAIVGDQCDNIPGAKGLGPAAAKTIFKHFNTVEEVLEKTDHPDIAKYASKLESSKDLILLSKSLTSLRTDAPLTYPEDFVPRIKNLEYVEEVLQKLDFQSFTIDQLTGWIIRVDPRYGSVPST